MVAICGGLSEDFWPSDAKLCSRSLVDIMQVHARPAREQLNTSPTAIGFAAGGRIKGSSPSSSSSSEPRLMDLLTNYFNYYSKTLEMKGSLDKGL